MMSTTFGPVIDMVGSVPDYIIASGNNYTPASEDFFTIKQRVHFYINFTNNTNQYKKFSYFDFKPVFEEGFTSASNVWINSANTNSSAPYSGIYSVDISDDLDYRYRSSTGIFRIQLKDGDFIIPPKSHRAYTMELELGTSYQIGLLGSSASYSGWHPVLSHYKKSAVTDMNVPSVPWSSGDFSTSDTSGATAGGQAALQQQQETQYNEFTAAGSSSVYDGVNSDAVAVRGFGDSLDLFVTGVFNVFTEPILQPELTFPGFSIVEAGQTISVLPRVTFNFDDFFEQYHFGFLKVALNAMTVFCVYSALLRYLIMVYETIVGEGYIVNGGYDGV